MVKPTRAAKFQSNTAAKSHEMVSFCHGKCVNVWLSSETKVEKMRIKAELGKNK